MKYLCIILVVVNMTSCVFSCLNGAWYSLLPYLSTILAWLVVWLLCRKIDTQQRVIDTLTSILNETKTIIKIFLN